MPKKSKAIVYNPASLRGNPHLLVRYETAPGEQYTYFGYCGYTGEVRREFIDPTTQKIPVNMCEKCREKLKGGLK